MTVKTPISVGELVDKLTILDIKLENISDEKKLSEIKNEKYQLEKLYKNFSDLDMHRDILYQINRGLWSVEDDIRKHEREQNFGTTFIRLARDVYQINDKRFEIKNKINELTNSEIKEVKSYESYS
tara:strand:- start:243 stop:620 length:378 start_codon:yes stop_codon:yes gene_type:complete